MSDEKKEQAAPDAGRARCAITKEGARRTGTFNALGGKYKNAFEKRR
jgi:hypothetical protein